MSPPVAMCLITKTRLDSETETLIPTIGGVFDVAQPIPYDLYQITAPVNRQNRKPGDPCHTLARDNAAHAAIAIQGTLIGRSENAGPQGSGTDVTGAMFTLTKTDVHAVAQPITFGAQMSVPQTDVDMVQTLQAKNPMAVAFGGDIARSLTARHDSSPCADRGMDVVAVAQPVAVDTYNHTISGDCAGSLTTTGGPPLSGPGVLQAMQVRRLLPEECEKLQGFLPGYTNIPWRNKPESPDGPRYKALGNSMAVPVMRWIGERINQVEAI